MFLYLFYALPVVTGFNRFLAAGQHVVKQAQLKHVIGHEYQLVQFTRIDLVDLRLKEFGIGLFRLP